MHGAGFLRSLLVAYVLAAFAVACGGTPEPPTAAPARRNVVLLSIDTLRPDRLGCYGGPPTPTLDRVAREGALFELTLTAAPATRTAHASMLTGVYPCLHGVSEDPETRLPPALTTLAEMLRGQGYTTAAITEGGALDEATFGRGFGSFSATSAGTVERPTGRVQDVVVDARAWLARHADAPFFLFLHTYQTHAPYRPPARYRDGKDSDADLYAGEVRYTDAALGPLFGALDDPRLRTRTIVIVTSDHGEAFGEHNHVGHGNELYEEDVRVPFLWWAPGLIPAGRRLGVASAGVDIVPTVLQLLGLERPPWIHGRDLARALLRDPPVAYGENMVYAEIPGPPGATRRMAVHGFDWKSFFPWPYPRSGPMTVADLNRDPGEERLQDIDGNSVSWIPYLRDICQRGAALLAARATPGPAGAPSAR